MAQLSTATALLRPATPPQRRFVTPKLSPSRITDATIANGTFVGGRTNLDAFSPVNQNGSFEFDRVIKSGKVHRRIKKKGAWKPSWKPAYLVLRPNLLSIYKNEDETDLRASVVLSDVTAVAPVRKAHYDNVFGVFTPSKNFQFQGTSTRDTSDWIALLRVESRIDELEELNAPDVTFQNHVDHNGYDSTDMSVEDDTQRPQSPIYNTKSHIKQRRISTVQEFSGNELATTSHSDLSDFQASSLPKNLDSVLNVPASSTSAPEAQKVRPDTVRNASQLSGLDVVHDPERVIRQGWLQVLNSKRGVKQWKRMWVVLRSKSIAFYKNEQEYAPIRILPMSTVVNAAEIDPISKSKHFCLQIIVDDKTYKLCAASEDSLAQWLGGLKSVLNKRSEAPKQLHEATAALSLR